MIKTKEKPANSKVVFFTTIHNSHQYLVPISKRRRMTVIEYKVLIIAANPYEAMNIAISEFSKDGWTIDPDYKYYGEL